MLLHQDEHGRTALHTAVAAGSELGVAQLLVLIKPSLPGLDPSAAEGVFGDDDDDDDEQKGEGGRLSGHNVKPADAVALINSGDAQRQTPLRLAVDRRDGPLVLELLRCRADVNSGDKDGTGPLHRAVMANDLAFAPSAPPTPRAF